MNTTQMMLNNQYLSGSSDAMTSAPISVAGNKAVLSVTVINVSSTAPTFSCRMQGSYDGSAWENAGSAVTTNSFGHYTQEEASISYAYLRVKAETTSAGNILIDASIALSEQ